MISKSRDDFLSSLRWVVSEASYQGRNVSLGYPTSNSLIIAAQNDAILNANYSLIAGGNQNPDPFDYNFKGVVTDVLGDNYRDLTDKVHFKEDRNNALTNVAGLWNTKIGSPSGTYSDIAATTPPSINMVKSGSSWTLYVSATYSEYRWLNMSSPNTNSPVSTSSSFSGSTGGSYACLVRDAAGKWNISQTIYTGCGSCRIGGEELVEWSEKELDIETKAYPIPFDKDLTIEFTVPSESMVRLELINLNGEVINKITDNVHAKGTYKYPVKNYINNGVLFYRLNVNGLGITKKIVKVN